ncbi:hypothetical protein [Parageobacillus sp. G301]|uniref:hypothetical protein n=1 Tax=Parageobacillus sp. G301 TaxID=2998290 RepID=UPI0024998768|nr:hypothetical protein [Parageobacillus sp. G301]GLH62397.1 hypothetical protein PG301_02370 [Parageobacillus sp. G301]
MNYFDVYKKRIRAQQGLLQVDELVKRGESLLQGELNHINYNEWVSECIRLLETKFPESAVTERFLKIVKDDTNTNKENLEKLLGLIKGLSK